MNLCFGMSINLQKNDYKRMYSGTTSQWCVVVLTVKLPNLESIEDKFSTIYKYGDINVDSVLFVI